MKNLKVYRNGHDPIEITAPADKDMVFDPALLQHGVLSVGEYGPSGYKIAAFNVWDYAVFDEGDHGYNVVRGGRGEARKGH